MSQLLQPDSPLQAGIYARPAQRLTFGRAGPLGHLVGSWSRKRWQFMSVVTRDILLSFAVVDLGYVGNVFAYAVDRSTGECAEYEAIAPLSRSLQVAPSSVLGVSSFDRPGFGSVVIVNDGQHHTRRIALHLEGSLGVDGRPPLHAEFCVTEDTDSHPPVVAVERTSGGGLFYTHKSSGLPAEGSVTLGSRQFELTPKTSFAGLDFNDGYRDRVTTWNWAAAAGFSTEGERVAFNLTAHRPLKRVTLPEDLPATTKRTDAMDCGVWIGNTLCKVDRVDFGYERPLGPWRVRDSTGAVDLHFKPLGQRKQHKDFGVVVSRFNQPFGSFQGTLKDDAGKVHRLGDVFGVTEEHYARW